MAKQHFQGVNHEMAVLANGIPSEILGLHALSAIEYESMLLTFWELEDKRVKQLEKQGS